MAYAIGGLSASALKIIDRAETLSGGRSAISRCGSAIYPLSVSPSLPSVCNTEKCGRKDRSCIHLLGPKLWKAKLVCGPDPSLCCDGSFGPKVRRKHSSTLIVRGESSNSHGEGCDPQGEFSYRRSSAPQQNTSSVESCDQSGYVIKVSKELMGVFQYVEKVKRARLRELSETLRQVAGACLFLSCVKGVVTPLVEVFKSQPPSWGKLILILGAFDAFAITYLAMKASEPLEQLSALATELKSDSDMMGSIEQEEEHMLALAVELVRLFRRLRNLALCTAITQFAQIIHALFRLQESQPNFAINVSKFVSSWLSTPWT